MNILLISSLIVITIQQCQEIGVSLFNNQLRSGLLPTYLFPEVIDPDTRAKIQFFSSTINVSSNGWTLSTKNFVSGALISDQIYKSYSQNQITVSNPNITIEVAFNFNNGSIKNGQGIAILNSNCSANYTFSINENTNKYSFSLINSYINFTNVNFSVVYANFPYQDGQLSEILETLNTNQLIQQGLNQYYNNNISNISSLLQSALSSLEITKGENFKKTYTYGKIGNKQTFTYTINISSIDIVYTPQVYYQAQAEMNIKGLTTPYICGFNISYTIPIPTNISNIEVISVDVISNSFMYAYQVGYFKTTLNALNWKVPFFSWTTGGLNNIMTSVYTSYYYSSQISGTCQAINASYIGWNPKSISFELAFNCSVTYFTVNTILNFQVYMPNVEVGIEFSKISKSSYFKILQVINPIITLYPVTDYPIDDSSTVIWFINEGIQNSFVGGKFYEGVFDSQRDIKSEDITYNIMNGIITITNIK